MQRDEDRLLRGRELAEVEGWLKERGEKLGQAERSFILASKDAWRREQQQRREAALGEAVLFGMTDAVVGVDKDLNATFLNPRARELLESSDLAFHQRLQELLAKSCFSGPVTEPEVWAGDRIIEIRAAPLEDGALAILRDVTEER